MATPSLTRSTICLRCVRRQVLSQTSQGARCLPIIQTRAYQKGGKKYDQGVVVRLLDDIPRFGRKDAIFLAPRGRMRNTWYPKKRAEYMTTERFAELGLTRDDIGERDPLFGVELPELEGEIDEVGILSPEEAVLPTEKVIELEHVSPARARDLLTALLPATLVFPRAFIPASPPPEAPSAPSTTPPPPAQAPRPARSPLIASRAGPAPPPHKAEATPTAASRQPAPPPAAPAIFGSVTPADVAVALRAHLSADPEAARVAIEPRDVRILAPAGGAGGAPAATVDGELETVDRVKTLGAWEVEITLRGGGGAAAADEERLRWRIEVVPPAEEEAAEGPGVHA